MIGAHFTTRWCKRREHSDEDSTGMSCTLLKASLLGKRRGTLSRTYLITNRSSTTCILRITSHGIGSNPPQKNSHICYTQPRIPGSQLRSGVVHSNSEPSAYATGKYTYTRFYELRSHPKTPRDLSIQTKSIVHLRRTSDQIMQTQTPLDASPLFFYVTSSLYAESIQAQPVNASMPLHHP